MPAFNVVRYESGDFKNFFERILSKHNQKMKAYVAVQKKLLVLIYTLWKKDEAFKPKRQAQTFGDGDTVPSFASANGQNEVAPA